MATSSALANSPDASVLSSQNALLRANLSRTHRLLQARESELSRDFQEANTQCVELERSLNLSKPWLLRLKRDLAKLKAELAKALEDLAHRHRTESSDQATALRQKVVMLKETRLQEKEEVHRVEEIFGREH